MTTNERLSELMSKHNLSRNDVAIITQVTPYAVDNWLRPVKDKSSRVMPKIRLEALEGHLAKHA